MGTSAKQRLRAALEINPELAEITPSAFAQLSADLQIPPGRLRRLLREETVKCHPLVQGVRQDSPQNLSSSLTALSAEYPASPKECRELVLESKQHARFALRRDESDPWRTEVLLHLNTWLENPEVYPIWKTMREKHKSRGA
jgi:hypothetical protein